MTEYQPNLHVDDVGVRYVLGHVGHKNVMFVGVNPSIADNKTADPTVRKVIGFAKLHGYDGWLIVNIYPQRATKPADIHRQVDSKITHRNREEIGSLLKRVRVNSIVACWGNLIDSRDFLKPELLSLVQELRLADYKWECLGTTKSGNPKHPSRQAYCDFLPFPAPAPEEG